MRQNEDVGYFENSIGTGIESGFMHWLSQMQDLRAKISRPEDRMSQLDPVASPYTGLGFPFDQRETQLQTAVMCIHALQISHAPSQNPLLAR